MMIENKNPELPKVSEPKERLIWGLPRTVVSFVVVAITSAIVYRVVTVQCSIVFDFPTLLSLLLALFAVALSALFYFKATDTSNAFYDNTYKFTQQIAELLREPGSVSRGQPLNNKYSDIGPYLLGGRGRLVAVALQTKREGRCSFFSMHGSA